MSLGHYGKCCLISETDESVHYQYWGNASSFPQQGASSDETGIFYIRKCCLNELNINQVKRKKYKQKKPSHELSIPELLQKGVIVVKRPCPGDFQINWGNIDIWYLAYHILRHVFSYYMEHREFPEREVFVK